MKFRIKLIDQTEIVIEADSFDTAYKSRRFNSPIEGLICFYNYDGDGVGKTPVKYFSICNIIYIDPNISNKNTKPKAALSISSLMKKLTEDGSTELQDLERKSK
jgi:hypothetical protein